MKESSKVLSNHITEKPHLVQGVSKDLLRKVTLELRFKKMKRS